MTTVTFSDSDLCVLSRALYFYRKSNCSELSDYNAIADMGFPDPSYASVSSDLKREIDRIDCLIHILNAAECDPSSFQGDVISDDPDLDELPF